MIETVDDWDSKFVTFGKVEGVKGGREGGVRVVSGEQGWENGWFED